MKLSLYCFSIVICFFSLFSCSKYSTRIQRFSHESSISGPIQEYGHTLTQEELILFAEKTVPSFFSLNKETKSSGKKIEGIVPYSQTKWYNDSFPGNSIVMEFLNNVYIINYENEEGFAVICADNRTEQLIAYSDSGNISFESDRTKSGIYDITGQHTINEILALLPEFFAELGEYIIPYPVLGPDSLDVNGYYYCSPQAYYSYWCLDEIQTAYTYAQWGQEAPYNYYYENQYDEHYGEYKPYIGCAAVALGQIMNRHSYPERISLWTDWTLSLSLDWPYDWQITADRDSTHALASLLRILVDVLGSIPSYSGTSTYTDSIKCALSSFNYTFDNIINNDMDSYYLPTIEQSITNGYPVVVFGFSTQINNGHYWDVEGYQKDVRYLLVDWDVYDPGMDYVGRWTSIDPTGIQTREYLFCNWGLDGQYNGWFNAGLFSINNVSFTQNLKMVTNIRPL